MLTKHRFELTDLTDVPSREITFFLEELSSMWVKGEHLSRACHQDFLSDVSEVLTRGGPARSLNERLARALLGRRLFGVSEWEVYLGEDWSWVQLQTVPEFPWNVQTLLAPCPFIPGQQVFETHVAFLGRETWKGETTNLAGLLPLTFTYQDLWFKDEVFAQTEQLQPRWYLVHVFPVNAKKLPAQYEIASAVETFTACCLGAIKGRAGWCDGWQEFRTRSQALVKPPKGLLVDVTIRNLDGQVEVYLSKRSYGLAASRRLPL